MWCIYKITNNINGKTYIGQHRYVNDDNPMYRYAGSGVALRKAYKKYGRENFSIEVLYKRIQYQETADSMEIWAIEKERKSNPNGCYNISNGGRGNSSNGRKHTEETKRKMSKSHKGINTWMKGRKLSKEHRKHISEGNKGKKLSEECKQKLSESHKGKTHSTETKQKLSEINKGTHRPDWVKKKISESTKGKPHPWSRGKKASEETRHKLSELQKGKNWYNNGIINKKARCCPDGFVSGRLPNKKVAKKGYRHWYTNGIENVMALECPEGFTPGRVFSA